MRSNRGALVLGVALLASSLTSAQVQPGAQAGVPAAGQPVVQPVANPAVPEVQLPLTGTWTSKSGKVITGPKFYDHVNDKLIEPELPGISYTFDNEGHYETALYKAIANPANPNCPSAIMQWQHGTYTTSTQGSTRTLQLKPIGVDGRQLYSDPCNQHGNAVYTRYDQIELYQNLSAHMDNFTNTPRLELYPKFGPRLNLMHRAFETPQILPTVTLHPTTSGTGAVKPTSTGKTKRSLDGGETSGEQILWGIPKRGVPERHLEDKLWWPVAIGTVITSLFYLRSWRL